MTLKELTIGEALWARAEANGYEEGVHREADERRDQEKHVDKTKQNQNGTLRRYIHWHLGVAQRKALQEGRPPPDEQTVHDEQLCEDAAAPALATVKDFLRFYIATSRPRLDERPTVDSINIVAEWFFAGFTRVTGTITEKEERSEVYNWVRRTLTREGIVVKKHRPKHNFTERDLTRVLRTLWTRDDLIFIPERYRIQTTFIINVFCWTGARIGAFFTGGLRYKDLELVLQRENACRWRLIYKVDQRWVKNNRDPENIVFGASTTEDGKLCYNDAGMLLIMAITDGALFGYETLDEVREQVIPPGQDELPLRFKDSALDRPVLRQCTKAGGAMDKPMPLSAFESIFKSTLTNAGYIWGPTVHAIRRQLGKCVDHKYTAVERSQHITQADPSVFGQSYVANCSSVDGKAAFHKRDGDHRHVEYFQSFEKFREEGLPDRLPAHLEEKLLRNPRLCTIQQETRTSKHNASRQRYTNLLKKTKLAALRQYQQNWVRERRDWKILTRGKDAAHDKSRTDYVRDMCLLIPERGRLAEQMSADDRLEPENMWLALQDLQSLCSQDFTVLYLPGSRPVDGACPIKCCQIPLDGLPKSQRNHHIQSCTQWDLAHRLNQLQSNIHYCYQCFDWVAGEEWEPHCALHLAEMTTKRCGTTVYCHTLVRPGYCPFCLNDPILPAAERSKSWTRDHKLWIHVNEHLDQCQWPRVCPHPLCDVVVDDSGSLQFHFVDEHSLSRSRPGKSASSKMFDLRDEKSFFDTGTKNDSPKRKRTSSNCTQTLQWLPPNSGHTTVVSEAETPAKRPRLEGLSICPTALFAETVDLTTPPPQYLQSVDQTNNLQDPLLPVYSALSNNSGDMEKREDDDDNTLFDQFLRSLSLSPTPISPVDVASLHSGSTLVDTGFLQPRSDMEAPVLESESFAPESVAESVMESRDRGDMSQTKFVNSIRLRVSQPKITLRLKINDTRFEKERNLVKKTRKNARSKRKK